MNRQNLIEQEFRAGTKVPALFVCFYNFLVIELNKYKKAFLKTLFYKT